MYKRLAAAPRMAVVTLFVCGCGCSGFGACVAHAHGVLQPLTSPSPSATHWPDGADAHRLHYCMQERVQPFIQRGRVAEHHRRCLSVFRLLNDAAHGNTCWDADDRAAAAVRRLRTQMAVVDWITAQGRLGEYGVTPKFLSSAQNAPRR